MLTVSDTAYAIATIRADEASRPIEDRLFEDPYATVFAAAGTHALEGTERFLALPFFRDAIRLRTRFIDDFVEERLAAGASQIVVVGAGFDSRALRLRGAERATWFEIDFAEQLDTKRALLDAAAIATPERVTRVPCDFAVERFEDTLERALGEAGFRVGAGAIFVWEGVIAYLGDAAIDRSLAFMARVGGARSRVVFDFGTGRFDREPLDVRARRAGFNACEEHPLDVIWRRYLPSVPHDNASLARIAILSV